MRVSATVRQLTLSMAQSVCGALSKLNVTARGAQTGRYNMFTVFFPAISILSSSSCLVIVLFTKNPVFHDFSSSSYPLHLTVKIISRMSTQRQQINVNLERGTLLGATDLPSVIAQNSREEILQNGRNDGPGRNFPIHHS
jgi:hypothetical protein